MESILPRLVVVSKAGVIHRPECANGPTDQFQQAALIPSKVLKRGTKRCRSCFPREGA